NQEMAEYDLRRAHVSCLYYIYKSENTTATELCEKCEEDKATISRALDYLEQNGFITCESKNAKRYKSPLLLTEKGSAVGKKISDKIDSVLDEISVGLSDAERSEFYRSLTVVSRCIESVANKSR
ncbi:MAG: MarR family transcriptional regulator, partial [Clostridia bacterium]|nr:MarR family transcriptional regulator [Clostridia bacterium]